MKTHTTKCTRVGMWTNIAVIVSALVACPGMVAAAVTVPDVRGLDVSLAGPEVNGAGLVAALVYEYSMEASGTVTGQSIAAGSMVDEGTTVTLTVSRGALSPEAYNYQGLLYVLMGLVSISCTVIGVKVGVLS